MSAPSLTEFLLARIAEDEAVARLALGADQGWYLDAGEVWVLHDPDGESASGLIDGFPIWADGAGEHIARHDPARVLAECEAKRRIMARHNAASSLRLLALPYAGHPDFQRDWQWP